MRRTYCAFRTQSSQGGVGGKRTNECEGGNPDTGKTENVARVMGSKRDATNRWQGSGQGHIATTDEGKARKASE